MVVRECGQLVLEEVLVAGDEILKHAVFGSGLPQLADVNFAEPFVVYRPAQFVCLVVAVHVVREDLRQLGELEVSENRVHLVLDLPLQVGAEH